MHDINEVDGHIYIEKYRKGVMPLLVCLNILKAWVIRFDEKYLKEQTFFQPYPEQLMPVSNIQLD